MSKCKFECSYLDESGECLEMGSECIEDMCENWNECGCCSQSEECENIK